MKTTLLLIITLGASVSLRETSPAAEKPDILIIFTDDQGYADLACFGNEKNKTPRLDQLAKEGTRFTSFYSQTVCPPSRSALLRVHADRVAVDTCPAGFVDRAKPILAEPGDLSRIRELMAMPAEEAAGG